MTACMLHGDALLMHSVCWVKDVWGVPAEAGHMRDPQPVRNTVKTMVDMAQQAAYHAFLSDRQKRSSHHPRGQHQLPFGSNVRHRSDCIMLLRSCCTMSASKSQVIGHHVDISRWLVSPAVHVPFQVQCASMCQCLACKVRSRK